MQTVANRYALGFSNTPDTPPTALTTEGAFPAWLRGTLVRNGPGIFDLKQTAYRHWFDGLALLHAFTFADGGVTYRSRYLDTPAWRDERQTGSIVYRNFASDPCRTLFKRAMSMFTPTPDGLNANINIARLADDFIALTETPLAVAFDPHTLETLRAYHYNDGTDGTPRLSGNLTTAHPHYDYDRRTGYNYLLKFGAKSVFQIIALDGGTRRLLATIPSRTPAYVHSIGMTERYLILAEFSFVLPSVLSVLLSGKPFIDNYRWTPELGAKFHVIEKETGTLITTAETDAFFAFHHINAFERGAEIVVDLSAYDDARLIEQLKLDHLRAPNAAIAVGRLRRYRIPLSSGRATYDIIGDETLELPRIHYRAHNGNPYRFAYGAGTGRAQTDFLNQLVKLDTETGAARVWRAPNSYPSEPVFIPAPHATREDDGIILSVVLDADAGRSYLLALDAASFTEIARAQTPVPVPFGFHGAYFQIGD